MPIFNNPRVTLAGNVRDAVREIRRLPADDRTKKEMLNQWFNERDMLRRAQQGGVRPTQVVHALLGGIFGRGPGVIARLREFERENARLIEPIGREQRRAAFDELLGVRTNARLRG